MKLKVGDKVRLKSLSGLQRIGGLNPEGRMDKYAGQIMTIRVLVGRESVFMEEDVDDFNGNSIPGWCWNREHIEEVVSGLDIDSEDLLRVLI